MPARAEPYGRQYKCSVLSVRVPLRALGGVRVYAARVIFFSLPADSLSLSACAPVLTSHTPVVASIPDHPFSPARALTFCPIPAAPRTGCKPTAQSAAAHEEDVRPGYHYLRVSTFISPRCRSSLVNRIPRRRPVSLMYAKSGFNAPFVFRRYDSVRDLRPSRLKCRVRSTANLGQLSR